MSPERDKLLDWGLTAFAVAFAALHLGLAGQAEPRASAVDVRAVEDLGRIYDAGQTYPTAVRDLIGLEGADADTPRAVVESARERIAELPPGRALHLIVAAMAAAWELEPQAHEALAVLEDAPSTPDSLRPALDDLARLASGKPLDGVERIASALSELGASDWIVARVRARHHALIGDADGAARANAEALASAAATVDARMTTLVTQGLALAFGLILLSLSPWLRPALTRRGHGLGPGPSPFRLDRSQRVIAGWFLGHATVSVLFSSLAAGMAPGDTRLYATLLNLQILAHGAIGVWLIEKAGRYGSAGPLGRPDLASGGPPPLGVVLGLGLGAIPGRAATVAAWVLPGLAVAVFITTAAQVVSLLLLGPPQQAQSAIELLVSDATLWTFALLALAAAVFAPLVEEILFRGYLYRNLRATLGPTLAMVLSGVIFAAVHLDPERFIPLAGLGFALALLYEWSGSLLVCVLVHGLWNFLQLLSVWAIYQSP